MKKPKTLMDKDLTWSERIFLIDMLIAEEVAERIDTHRRAFAKSRGYMVGADYSPKTRVQNNEKP